MTNTPERVKQERRDEADVEALADKTMLKGLTVEDGAMTLSLVPPREIVAVWVQAAREMIGDAENYVEMEFKLAGEVERFAFVLQRVGKLTPHQARRQAEDRAEAAEREVARVREVLAKPGHRCLNPWPCTTIRALDGEE